MQKIFKNTCKVSRFKFCCNRFTSSRIRRLLNWLVKKGNSFAISSATLLLSIIYHSPNSEYRKAITLPILIPRLAKRSKTWNVSLQEIHSMDRCTMLKHPVYSLAPLPYVGVHPVNLRDAWYTR